ncbi:MAG: TAXI family TRAP transporter solute-binding subunit [Candidatus Accumulibacter sp.]|jgi:TRAP transporter TAXI family solute receptor|nr:TAXI family TRAP transporter solute-binding subunit [Accumulibacter sp.]
MKQYKLKSLLSITALSVSLCAGVGVAQAKDYVSVATGGTSGTYYPIGGAIAQAASKSGVLQATAETGNASVANLNLIGKGEIEVGFAQNDTAFWAYNGQQMFKEPMKNLRTVAALYPEHVQVIIAKDAKVNLIGDLKGKRVSVGAAGSGVEADVRAIFDVAKLTYNDMKVDHLDFGATTSRFKDNQIDAGFVVAGFPTASIMDLTTTKDVDLLSFSEEFLAQLNKAHPYFVASIIPANTYRGIEKETRTPAVVAMLVTHDKVSEEVIYEFVKGMYENLDTIHASHATARQITLETALDGVTIPVHAGAAKYYKEKGITIPEIQ